MSKPLTQDQYIELLKELMLAYKCITLLTEEGKFLPRGLAEQGIERVEAKLQEAQKEDGETERKDEVPKYKVGDRFKDEIGIVRRLTAYSREISRYSSIIESNGLAKGSTLEYWWREEDLDCWQKLPSKVEEKKYPEAGTKYYYISDYGSICSQKWKKDDGITSENCLKMDRYRFDNSNFALDPKELEGMKLILTR